MAFCEVSQDQSPGTPAAAGDFGFKVLTSSDPAEKTKKLSAELANGRLAMMAIIGMFFQASSERLQMCVAVFLMSHVRTHDDTCPPCCMLADMPDAAKSQNNCIARVSGVLTKVDST